MAEDEREMTTFEALNLLVTEGISQLNLAPDSLHIDFRPEHGLSLFYASFDGICQHGQN